MARLIERDPESADALTMTTVVSREGTGEHAFIYTVNDLFITAFTVDDAAVEALRAEMHSDEPLFPRFNAVLPLTSSAPADRTWQHLGPPGTNPPPQLVLIGASHVTRTTKHFEPPGVECINPWNAPV